MKRPVRILLVEDSDDDAWIVRWELQRAGFNAACRRIQSTAELVAALEAEAWDAVIADYNLPGLNGMEALALTRGAGLDIPFILVSGAIGEEIAAAAMKAGANDYVRKGNLARLGPVLERELGEAAARVARRAAEGGLRLLSLAVHQSPAATLITDLEGCIQYANPKYVEASGYSEDELIGKTSAVVKSGLTPPAVYGELWAALRAGRPWRGALRNRRKNGELYWFDTAITPLLDEAGEVINFVAVTEDITLRLQAEEEIRRLNADLEQRVAARTRELQATNQSLEAFSYSVSHDLRAPLAMIRSFAEALAKSAASKLDASCLGYLERIRGGASRMERLIDDLLSLSQVTRSDFNPRDIDLSALARAVCGEAREADPQRRCEIVVQPGMRVHGDSHLLHIALANLVANAWKFSARRDAVSIEVGQAPPHDGDTTVFVRDRGAGFDPSLAGKLFEPFQRLHNAADFPGTGIGLAIVRRVVERHGGSIRGEGAVDQGATFWLSLPHPTADG